MGARLYLPELGRFAQVDPIEGGTENNYVYPVDPVNEFDLTGEATFSGAHIGESSNCLGKAFGGCLSHLTKKTSAALSFTPAGFARSAGTKLAGLAWASGTRGGGHANMMAHFAKHGKSLGYRGPISYTLGAYKSVAKSTVKHLYKNGRVATMGRDLKLTVRQGLKLVTHFKPTYPTNYWIRNVVRR